MAENAGSRITCQDVSPPKGFGRSKALGLWIFKEDSEAVEKVKSEKI